MLFNFGKVRDCFEFARYRISRKSGSCQRFLNQSDVIDTFFSWMAIVLHAFFQKYHIETCKRINIHCGIRKFNKNIFRFLSLFLLFFLFCLTSHFRQKFEDLALVTSQSQRVVKLKSCAGKASVYVVLDNKL